MTRLIFRTFVIFLGLSTAKVSLGVLRLHGEGEETALPAEELQSSPYTVGGFSTRIGMESSYDKNNYFSDDEVAKYYKKLYSNTNSFYFLQFEQKVFHHPFFSLGVGGKLSFYQDSGKQVEAKSGGTEPEDLTFPNSGGGLSLTLIPYQVQLLFQFSPLGESSFFNIDVWGGYEELYFQEVRTQAGGSDASSAALLAAAAFNQESTSSKSLISTGWNAGFSYGIALNLRLTALDEKSVRSMSKTLGFRSVYLSPFLEKVQSAGNRVHIAGKKASEVKFFRTSMGIGLTFASL